MSSCDWWFAGINSTIDKFINCIPLIDWHWVATTDAHSFGMELNINSSILCWLLTACCTTVYHLVNGVPNIFWLTIDGNNVIVNIDSSCSSLSVG